MLIALIRLILKAKGYMQRTVFTAHFMHEVTAVVRLTELYMREIEVRFVTP